MRYYLAKIYYSIKRIIFNIKGYNIGKGTQVERKVRLDKLNPKGLVIGENSLIASGSVILTHSHVVRCPKGGPLFYNTKIGSNCFIGINVIVNPGIYIGDNVIIGDGSIVTTDIASNSFAAGNPARIIKKIQCKNYGIII